MSTFLYKNPSYFPYAATVFLTKFGQFDQVGKFDLVGQLDQVGHFDRIEMRKFEPCLVRERKED